MPSLSSVFDQAGLLWLPYVYLFLSPPPQRGSIPPRIDKKSGQLCLIQFAINRVNWLDWLNQSSIGVFNQVKFLLTLSSVYKVSGHGSKSSRYFLLRT